LLLLRRLQCLGLSRLSRFPFHDSQVYFRPQKHGIYSVLDTFSPKLEF
jgi:hypothetical protein